ncbi:putative Csl4p protein [Leptomonas pyrrhocoris]|uniref:Putative Csl4p protein n=1 Tax=Leptomonas pyrrhocoris TaxID=157538 RepID=A0A0M9G7A7_LEPPY|nr:putative Csl4p protein [Leptomonas pyrrhocoris]KPA83809.1 putative Csl4p protein [Leptomonas pyrrhocoris]|eukprot:XP_015662248.1 putative Csl4p protein [Leptomonas pyrrhocoris]
MPVVVHTGSRVAPGDALFTSAAAVAAPNEGTAAAPPADEVVGESEVIPGQGCVVQYVEEPVDAAAGAPQDRNLSRVRRCIVATRQGVAQWDGRLVSVFAATPSSTAGTAYSTPQLQLAASRGTGSGGSLAGSSVGATASTAAVMGPRPGDTVHLRVTRLNRLFAFGEIIAVNWRWCSHRSAATAGISGVFKGVLRQEDIRPFRPTKDQLLPPAPALAFAPGDVVLAEVISQSDAHQYQLSTVGEGFGVVESYMATSEEQYNGREKVKLQHIPGRRDAMMVPSTGSVVPRWCPLLP